MLGPSGASQTLAVASLSCPWGWSETRRAAGAGTPRRRVAWGQRDPQAEGKGDQGTVPHPPAWPLRGGWEDTAVTPSITEDGGPCRLTWPREQQVPTAEQRRRPSRAQRKAVVLGGTSRFTEIGNLTIFECWASQVNHVFTSSPARRPPARARDLRG